MRARLPSLPWQCPPRPARGAPPEASVRGAVTGRADKWDAEMLTATRPLDNHPDESMFVVDERVLAFDPLASVYKSKVLRRRFRRPVDSSGAGADAGADADAGC